jgi:hypothetical protein
MPDDKTFKLLSDGGLEKSANKFSTIFNKVLPYAKNFLKGFSQPALKGLGTSAQVAGYLPSKIPVKPIAQAGANLIDYGGNLRNVNSYTNIFNKELPKMQRLGRAAGTATYGAPLALTPYAVGAYGVANYAPLDKEQINKDINSGGQARLYELATQLPGDIHYNANSKQNFLDTYINPSPYINDARRVTNSTPRIWREVTGSDMYEHAPAPSGILDLLKAHYNQNSMFKIPGAVNLNDWLNNNFYQRLQEQNKGLEKSSGDRFSTILKTFNKVAPGANNFLKGSLSRIGQFLSDKDVRPGASTLLTGLSALSGGSAALNNRRDATPRLGVGMADAKMQDLLTGPVDEATRLNPLFKATPAAVKNVWENVVLGGKSPLQVIAPAAIPNRPNTPLTLNPATNTYSTATTLDPNAGQKPNFALGNQ